MYKFTLTHSGTSRALTDAATFGAAGPFFAMDREQGAIDYRIELGGELTLRGEDYTFVEGIVSADVCDEVTLEVHDGAHVAWTGILRLRPGDFDHDACVAVIPVDPLTEASCVDERMGEEVNLITMTGKRSVLSAIGTVTFTTCQEDRSRAEPSAPPVNCLGVANPTPLYALHKFTIELTGGQYRHTAVWAQEEVQNNCDAQGQLVTPEGGGWLKGPGACPGPITWYRAAPLRNYPDHGDLDGNTVWDLTYPLSGFDASGQPFTYENGMPLENVLSALLAPCNLTVESDFFGWGSPPGVGMDASAELGDLLLFQRSDILRPEATQSATQANMTLASALRALRELFQVHGRVRGNTYRLEHISYWVDRQGGDLRTEAPESIRGQARTTFPGADVPPREEFVWDGPYASAFTTTIHYGRACSDASAEPVTHDPGPFTTDMSTLQGREDEYDEKGWVLLSVDGHAIRYWNDMQNGYLSWPFLVQHYYQHYRYAPVDNSAHAFASTRPMVQGPTITLPSDGAAFFARDLNERIATQLGWGQVMSARFNAFSCTLSLDLAY